MEKTDLHPEKENQQGKKKKGPHGWQSPKASVLVPDAAAASAAGLFFFHFFRQVGRGELFPDAVALFPGLGHQAQLLDQHLADDQHFFHIGQLFEVRGIGAEIFGSVPQFSRSHPENIHDVPPWQQF